LWEVATSQDGETTDEDELRPSGMMFSYEAVLTAIDHAMSKVDELRRGSIPSHIVEMKPA